MNNEIPPIDSELEVDFDAAPDGDDDFNPGIDANFDPGPDESDDAAATVEPAVLHQKTEEPASMPPIDAGPSLLEVFEELERAPAPPDQDADEIRLREAIKGALSKPAEEVQAKVTELGDYRRKRDEKQLTKELLAEVMKAAAAGRLDAVRALMSSPTVTQAPSEPAPLSRLTAELGPEPWLCKALALQPGAPLMLSGHSGLGKSWVMTDLALAVASGQWFIDANLRRGKVHWMHLEGSERDLQTRFQRMGAARGIGLAELDGWFLPHIHPRFSLARPDAANEKMLCALTEGAALMVIDTYAVATAGMDENSTVMRQPLDMLTRVSGKTGCAFVVIHHHRKLPADAKSRAEIDLSSQTRGSSALENALAASWAITKCKGGPPIPDCLFHSKLTLGKSWYGERPELEITATWSSVIPGGVDVSIMAVREGAAPDAPPDANRIRQMQAVIACKKDIVRALQKQPERVTLKGLRELVGSGSKVLNEALRDLQAEGRIDSALASTGARQWVTYGLVKNS